MKQIIDNAQGFTLTYKFNAPQKLVFNAFSNAKALAEWWGPVECKTTVLRLDFREGGIFHFQMEANSKITYGRFLFKQIKPYHTLEFVNAFSDERANIVPAPFDIQLPLEIFYQLKFIENSGITTIELLARPINANEEETRVFHSISPSMVDGFGATFGKLESYLKKYLA
jgi:uncharacterized protein YndB with AHSA1/START domain